METLKLILVLLILVTVAYLVYKVISSSGSIREAFREGVNNVVNIVKDPLSIFGPDKVITPKRVQDFIDEPANKPGGYVPWTPEVEPEETYPPKWLKKSDVL